MYWRVSLAPRAGMQADNNSMTAWPCQHGREFTVDLCGSPKPVTDSRPCTLRMDDCMRIIFDYFVESVESVRVYLSIFMCVYI